MRSLFPLKKCCLCSLRVASMIVGFLYSIFGIVGIYLVLSEMSFSSEISTDDNTDSGLDTGAPLQKIQLIISFLAIASAILVLIVVCQNGRHCLLLPGLIFHAVLAVFGFVFTFYYAVLHYNEQDNDTGKNYLLACFGIAVLGFINWWVIYSYYKELREDDKKNKTDSSKAYNIIPTSVR